MVYMYLVHYADHDSTCRDLALLSINAFQRGLSDNEQFIRALALRVLTSIRVNDVIQIQILAVQTCTKDPSPYVRKCASNALGKLYPRLSSSREGSGSGNGSRSGQYDPENQARILGILKEMLVEESCTMVLTSVMCSFCEICPSRLEMLHGCYRKLCHLLTDMDEWGQVIVMDVLSRYCRTYFSKPGAGAGGVGSATPSLGSAEAIDRQRRIVRRLKENGEITSRAATVTEDNFSSAMNAKKKGTGRPPSEESQTKKSKRRVVKKGFYSDDEDDSSEDDLIPHAAMIAKGQSVASTMRQRNVLGFGNGVSGVDGNFGPHGAGGVADATGAVDEDSMLAEDHRLLLRSSLPLLKSRNSGVVLGVCSLHYYCGVASIKIRSALGKSLVRIYHDRREIQFVVLNSIRTLVWECPSAFTPFLNDFFVKAMDPSFTRLIKLDILAALALEPNSINAVLKELKTYIRHHDKNFVCASIRLVGKIVEMARIVYDRQGEKTGNAIAMREEANLIALNCLHGILTIMESSSHKAVVAECIGVTQRIIVLLQSDEIEPESTSKKTIADPQKVQFMSLRRLVLLVVGSIAANEINDADEEKAGVDADIGALKNQTIILPTIAVAPALWILGECLCSGDNKSKSYLKIFRTNEEEKKLILSELLRLLAKFFPEMDPPLKCHCIHFASKVLLTNHFMRNGLSQDRTLCEYILGLGRVDINQDVRDRSRNESLVIHMSIGIQYDVDTLPNVPMNGSSMTVDAAKSMLLSKKPSSSWLPIESEIPRDGNDDNASNSPFRFGTLSSMVSHKAGNNYLPLPPWAEEDSPKKLRDPPQPKVPTKNTSPTSGKKKRGNVTNSKITSNGFYDSDSDESSSSSSSGSDSDESSSSSESSSDSSSSSSDDESHSSSDDESEGSSDSEAESTSSEETSDVHEPTQAQPSMLLPSTSPHVTLPMTTTLKPMVSIADSSDSDDSSSSSSSSDDSGERIPEKKANTKPIEVLNKPVSSLIDMNYNQPSSSLETKPKDQSGNPDDTSLVSGLEGLVMAPLKIDKEENTSDGDVDDDSSNWVVLVRHDLSGGLSVTARFLRNSSRKRELLLLGLDPKNAAVVCVQIRFENRRTDGRGIRRIRLMQRKVATNGTIPTTRTAIPQEIDILNSSQISYAMVGLEFAQVSDKDGATLARFDVKCDRSSNSIDIRPPLAELLVGSKMKSSDFDEAMQKLHGIHQRAVSKFDSSSIEGEVSEFYDDLPVKILKASNLTMVGKKKWSNGVCRFVGCLPASNKEVLVRIQCDKKTGSGEVTICCDNAMALSSLLAFLKGVAFE